jgi:UMF1 family MFS transporter
LEQLVEAKPKRKLIYSWAFYDWANSAFATTVMAGFFPLFFKKYWTGDFPVVTSTYYLGVINSVSSLILALVSPALGAVADQGAWRKRFLFLFTGLGIFGSGALGLISQGEWVMASVAYSVGLLGFSGALPFYDALLVEVADRKDFDRVSALGYALGYLGGGLLFLLNVAMYLSPSTFGFPDAAVAVRFSFITVAFWWFFFSIPLFRNVIERPARLKAHWLTVTRGGFKSFWLSCLELRRNRALLFFLLGFLFYNDAVNTIVKMAVDYGMSLGLEPSDLIKALLMVQFIGFPAAILFGRVGEKHSPLVGIAICLVVYTLATYAAYRLQTSFQFFALAAVIGVVQGGIQSLSRSYFARLVNPDDSAQFFGFFNMIGRFSSIAGPFLVGWVSLQTGNPRAGILILILFFAAGGVFLSLSTKRRAA